MYYLRVLLFTFSVSFKMDNKNYSDRFRIKSYLQRQLTIAHVFIRLQVFKDAHARQNKPIVAEKFETFDYTNDAIFESFRDYPRKKQLYRKHKDIAKDYERKVKFYRSCQKWYTIETNRQMHNVGERFCKLLKHTFETTENRSNGLRNSYNLWFPNHNTATDKTSSSNKEVGKIDENLNFETLENVHVTSVTPSTRQGDKRLHSFRSLSVDNIPKVEDNYRASGMIEKRKSNEVVARSCTNLASS